MRTRGAGTATGLAAVVLLTAGCSDQRVAPEPMPTTGRTISASPSPSASVTSGGSASPTGAPGSSPPAWLGTRVLPVGKDGVVPPQNTPPELRRRAFTLPDVLPELPGDDFESVIEAPAPPDVIARSTWSAECPVPATRLAWVRLTFWGFDDKRHTGELLVAKGQAKHIVTAFHGLWDLHFPLEQMHITTVAERDAPPTGDGNNTSAFNCRPARGTTVWSEHAYGLAVDVNPFQNPYTKGDVVLPELARSYVDRNNPRPGMIMANSPAVRAFSEVGWNWGGYWTSLKDLQHFSLRNR
ncbi:M15 family metallopeptidase [Nocardioides sp. Kera G14]|uniref:M15 family metallopeptidase n=1 Tax=Nocardioides sp. Kera G14 TaxID=2884264 RepID=UPI001D10F41A|nr:M15 family metallopeptidase [Nocardioides sp. Kera G14]UDY22994.1 M15 family metallopeptidase [Nocardioides sp. Kera G14]